MSESLLAQKRSEFHAGLIASGTLSINAASVASISDRSNKLSCSVGRDIAEALSAETIAERLAGQTMGSGFEDATADFLRATFPHFSMLRPGQWDIRRFGNSRRSALSQFEPYQHLADLADAIERDPTLVAALGNAYAISPDVIVSRRPESDDFINANDFLVDAEVGRETAIRSSNASLPILHAVVSCKWTLRSDRAQNARSEALNLIRNRKGRLPHVVIVTAEPTPSRLSSLALGTGDIDCVYHIALPELMAAMTKYGNDDNVAQLKMMVEGRRLKDISSLPLDLTV